MNEQTKTPLKLKLGYAMGEIGSQSIWYMINSYLMLFYTDVLSISAGAISMIMLVARIWDAVNDPMMGAIADRTKTRWGKFRPYLIFTPPVLAVFNILTFTVLPVSGAAKVALALIFYIGAGMAYTVCVTAYASIVNLIVKKSQDRQNLLAGRQTGNAIAQLILSMSAMPLILLLGKSDVANAKGFFLAAVVFSLFSVPCIWITAFTCKETYGEELHQETGEKKSFAKSLKILAKNDQLMVIIGIGFGMSLAIMGRMTLLSYYIIYVLGSYQLIGAVYGIMSVASLLTSFTIAPGTKRFGKKNYTFIINGIMVVGMLLIYLMPHANTTAIMVFSFLVGVGSAGQGVIFGMVSDCIDYGELKLGVREEGITSSLVPFSAKLATAIVGAGGVLILAKVGYVPNAEQTAAAQAGINFVVNMLPVIFVAVSSALLFFYKLSNEKMAEIAAELDHRRASNK